MNNIQITLLSQIIFLALATAVPGKEKPKPIVFVKPAIKTEIFDELSYPARAQSVVNAALLSESDGVVEAILVKLGERVRKGTPLMKVKHTDPVYEYKPVVVSAPVNGVVGAINVTLGSRVRTGDNLGSITNPRKIKLIVELSAQDLSALPKGKKGVFSFAGSEQSFAVELAGISPYVDPGTGTATAELLVAEERDDIVLQPGRVGRATFKTRDHKGFQFPEDAVIHRNKATFLRVVKDGKASLVPVKLGAARRGVVEIESGITEKQDVIVRSSQFVADGEEVVIEEEKVK